MSFGKSSPPPPPDYAALAAQQGQESRDTAAYNSAINRVDQYTPYGSSTWTVRPGADPENPRPGDYIQTTQLSPEQQGLYNQQNQISGSLLNTGLAGLGRVGEAQSQPFDTSQLAGFTGQIQGVRGVPAGADDASRRRVEEAMMARQNQDFALRDEDTRTRLLNSGLSVGSDAWNAEMNRLDRARNDAQMQAVLAGGQEESRQVGLNAALQQQEYGQAMSSAQFGNQARQQSLQEQAYLRQLPLNELNALRTGAQVQNPQFQSYYTGGQAQAAPYFDAGVAQGNYDLAQYNANQGGQNALWGGLANLGSAAIFRYSDRRLKERITRIGTTKRGYPLYQWKWRGSDDWGAGVMADEVPADAVRFDAQGYAMVDYSKVL